MPFFWLSTYEGKGDPRHWGQLQQTDFDESGARFVRVGDMAHGLSRLTRQIVEQPEDPDPHFCMPGAVCRVDEAGVLILSHRRCCGPTDRERERKGELVHAAVSVMCKVPKQPIHTLAGSINRVHGSSKRVLA